MLKQFCEHLGLKYLRTEGNELIHECPWCQCQKFYVNSKTGAWQCFHGCGEGHPYQLVKKLTALEPKGIFELLERFGLGQDSPTAARTQQQAVQPPKKLHLKPEDVKPLHLLDQLTFCHAKSIDREALLKLRPYRHAREPLVLLPAFNPGADMNKACGWIRCGLDGRMVNVKYLEDGVAKVKEEKYPVVKGSTPGLLGVQALAGHTDNTIVYVEGWKDLTAALQLNLPALANSNGAGKWQDSWLGVFKDKTVYIVGDCDEAGVKGAVKFASKIHGTAKDVRIVSLPYEPNTGQDLHDYIVRDKHSKDDLMELFKQAKKYEPKPSDPDAIILADDKPNTIVAAFEAQSNVKHRYNEVDGWTIFKDGKYQQTTDEAIEIYLRRFLCRILIKTTKANKPLKTTTGVISNLMAELKSLDHIYLRPSQSAPCSLTGRLESNKIIPCNNGLLDWSVYPYKLHNLTEDYYTLNYLPYDWNGENDSEIWIKFLIDVTQGDEEMFTLLQQWAGYCLMRHNQKEQKFMICFGDGGTGKSVFVDVLTHLLGKDNISAVPLERFDDPHYVVDTYGKLLNVTDESESHLEEAVESHLKHYTGGTMYSFKRLYHSPFSAYPTAKIMIVTNHLPAFKDTSEGIWRRLLLAPFNYIVPAEKRVKGLAQQIITSEMSGVLKWALEGARKLDKYGFIEPKICIEAASQYRMEAVPELSFFEENFQQCDPAFGVKCDTLRACYDQWCKAQGIGIKSQKKLTKTMQKLFPLCERKRGRDGIKLAYFYFGVNIKEESEFYSRALEG